MTKEQEEKLMTLCDDLFHARPNCYDNMINYVDSVTKSNKIQELFSPGVYTNLDVPIADISESKKSSNDGELTDCINDQFEILSDIEVNLNIIENRISMLIPSDNKNYDTDSEPMASTILDKSRQIRGILNNLNSRISSLKLNLIKHI